MPPRDCGCPEGPSLETLLAAARGLPTIRDRRPAPARVAASMSGWMRWGLINRAGREVRGGEGPNLILDQGLDQIAAQELRLLSASALGRFPLMSYAAVGTDNTAPAVGQTGLGAEVGRVFTTFASDNITRPSNGVYEMRRSIEFDYAVGNGNLTEWGFSFTSEAGNLFNRALFLDGGGSPEVVTKTTDFKLRIIYTLRVTLSPIVMTPGSFTITGVGTVNGEYALVGAGVPTTSGAGQCETPDLLFFSALARGALGTTAGATNTPQMGSIRARNVDLSTVAYTDVLSYSGDTTLAQVARDVLEPRDAYTPGSFERTGGLWRFDTGFGNLDPIFGFAGGGSAAIGVCQTHGYVFAIDSGDRFEKDNEHTLSIGAPTVTWGRA